MPTSRLSRHPLEILKSKHIIGDDLYAAGCRFMEDWEKAGRSLTHESVARDKIDASVSREGPDAIIDAKTRIRTALEAINTTSRLLVLDVCAEGKSLDTVRKKRGFPQHYVGPRFREALEELAAFYYKSA